MSDAALAAVPEFDDENDRQPSADRDSEPIIQIPRFEGEEVVATKAKITSVAGLEIGDRTFRVDESVKLVVEAVVVGVDHKVNNGGHIERIHVLKAIDSMVIDWGMDMDGLREALS